MSEDGTVGWHHQLYVNLSKLQETVKNREAWHAAVHGLTKSWTRLKQLNDNNLRSTFLANFKYTI